VAAALARVLIAFGLILVPQLGYAAPTAVPQPVQEEEEKERESKRSEGSRHSTTPPPRPRSAASTSHRFTTAHSARSDSDAVLRRAASLDHFRNGLGAPPRC
jgi:hypothetical protein